MPRAAARTYAINYHEDAFDVTRQTGVTGGRGVDVVFDSVGGDVTAQWMRCMAFGARLLALGFAGGIEAEDEATLTPRPLLFGNFSLLGVCWAYVDDPLAFPGARAASTSPRTRTAPVCTVRCSTCLRRGAIRPVIGQRASFFEPAGGVRRGRAAARRSGAR